MMFTMFSNVISAFSPKKYTIDGDKESLKYLDGCDTYFLTDEQRDALDRLLKLKEARREVSLALGSRVFFKFFLN